MNVEFAYIVSAVFLTVAVISVVLLIFVSRRPASSTSLGSNHSYAPLRRTLLHCGREKLRPNVALLPKRGRHHAYRIWNAISHSDWLNSTR